MSPQMHFFFFFTGMVAFVSVAQPLQSHVLFLKAQTDFPDALLPVAHATTVVPQRCLSFLLSVLSQQPK